MSTLQLKGLAFILAAALLLGACATDNGIKGGGATSITNPSPAPSSPLEPSRAVDRTVAPNETPGPAQTATPGT